VVSATISSSPTMVYFGQEVGEAGNEEGGFGKRSRTSIFDYVGVPNHQRWMNGGLFDGGKLTPKEKELRDFYSRLLNFTLRSDAMNGKFQEIQTINRNETANYDPGLYSYVRYSDTEKLIIVTNFSWVTTSTIMLKVPADVIAKWQLKGGDYPLKDQLYGKSAILSINNGIGLIKVTLKPSESFIYKLEY
jgi:hypothetical protein